MFDKTLAGKNAIGLVFRNCGGRIPLSPEPRGRSRQAGDLWERAVKREVHPFRVLPCLLAIASLILVVLPVSCLPASGQTPPPPPVTAPSSSEGIPQDSTKRADAKPAKDDVTKNSPGAKLKPLQGLHLDVDLALVNVTVTDPYNRLVTGLDPDNFRVYEDNIEQEVVTFSSEDVPISIGVIFDFSGSMANKIGKAREAAVEFFKTANPQDEFFLVSFNERAELTSAFTNSVEDLQSRMMLTAPKGRTALLDAIYLGLSQMRGARNGRTGSRTIAKIRPTPAMLAPITNTTFAIAKRPKSEGERSLAVTAVIPSCTPVAATEIATFQRTALMKRWASWLIFWFPKPSRSGQLGSDARPCRSPTPFPP